MLGDCDRAAGPELDQCIDVLREGNGGRELENGVGEDVALQRAHEEERGGAGIRHVHRAGGVGAPEVIGDRGVRALRRTVAVRIEGEDDGRALRVHGHDDAGGDDVGDERHDLVRDAGENDARIALRVDRAQLEDDRWRTDEHAALHRQAEELLLRADVTEERGGRDAELAADVGQGGGLEAFSRKDAASGLDDLFPGDRRRPAHL